MGSGGKARLDAAASLVNQSRHVYITGIGASWHASIGVQHLFQMHGIPAHAVDTAELEIMWPIAADATVIVLSRSGRSIEIIRVLEKAKHANARIVAITNAGDSPLARGADVALLCNVQFDNAASIATYTAPGLVGGLLAARCAAVMDEALVASLSTAFAQTGVRIHSWRDVIERSDWLNINAPTFFLARGGSMASSYEGRLLWIEVARAASSAMGTGAFRHGPQEILAAGRARIAIWIDAERSREQDMQLVRDLRKYDCPIFLIGQKISGNSTDLCIDLPQIPADWQFLIDIVPLQIAVEIHGMWRGFDPDSFEICSHVVESEGGL